jgi:ABC-2 type transport system permease protein
MDKSLALLQASWRAAKSYRLRLAISIAALALSVLPMWYVAGALQPVMASKIRGQGTEYTSFLVVGMIVFSLLQVSINALPNSVAGGIANGSLEALLATKIRMPSLFVGLFAYDLSWALMRAAVILATAALLGAHIAWWNALSALPILMLILLAYFPFALLGTASILAFRTAGPFPQAVLVTSGLLGGAYFPTNVIPDLVKNVSKFIPLTYGLRALRSVLLDGNSLANVSSDIAAVAGMAMVLTAVSLIVLMETLRRVRRGGGLSQY